LTVKGLRVVTELQKYLPHPPLVEGVWRQKSGGQSFGVTSLVYYLGGKNMKLEIKKILYEGGPRMEWENGIPQRKIYPSLPQNEFKNSAKTLISFLAKESASLKGCEAFIDKRILKIIKNKISEIYNRLNDKERKEVIDYITANRLNTGIKL